VAAVRRGVSRRFLALKTRRLLWSIHDVAPRSLDSCEALVELLVAAGVSEIAILVIPAGSWSVSQLHTLRRWGREGHLLGLHGWSHRSVAPRSIYHRLHSAVFSRDVAEHLGRPRSEVLGLVQRGVRWFDEVGLEPPRLYVPPAWALGEMRARDFHRTSIRWVETFTGIYDVETRRHRLLPLAGFEADTTMRAWSLRASNRANALAALATHRPLRVAVHPHDLELRLASDLRKLIGACHPSMPLSGL
jgi:uncharacterized protein